MIEWLVSRVMLLCKLILLRDMCGHSGRERKIAPLFHLDFQRCICQKSQCCMQNQPRQPWSSQNNNEKYVFGQNVTKCLLRLWTCRHRPCHHRTVTSVDYYIWCLQQKNSLVFLYFKPRANYLCEPEFWGLKLN